MSASLRLEIYVPPRPPSRPRPRRKAPGHSRPELEFAVWNFSGIWILEFFASIRVTSFQSGALQSARGLAHSTTLREISGARRTRQRLECVRFIAAFERGWIQADISARNHQSPPIATNPYIHISKNPPIPFRAHSRHSRPELEFAVWNFSGIWMLDFGIFYAHSRLLPIIGFADGIWYLVLLSNSVIRHSDFFLPASTHLTIQPAQGGLRYALALSPAVWCLIARILNDLTTP